MKLTIALSKSVTKGSIFWEESLSFKIEALDEGRDVGVGLETVEDDEDSVLTLSGSVSRLSWARMPEVWSTTTLAGSVFEAWMTASSRAIRALRLSLLSIAASCKSSRLCSVHLFPLEIQPSHTVESLAKMHRIFRILHS